MDDKTLKKKKGPVPAKIIFVFAAVVNVLLYALLMISSFKGLEFFKIKSIGLFIIDTLIIFSPTAICLILFFVFEKLSKSSKRRAVFGLILSLILMVVFAVNMAVYSPFASMTNNYKDYLILDKQSEISTGTFGGLFPESIPKEAMDIQYDYRCFSYPVGTFEVFAEWTLPKTQYDAEKKRVSGKYASVMHNKYGSYYMMFISEDETNSYNYLFFAYDDATMTVRYGVSYIDSVDTAKIKPYYKTIKW